MIFFTINKQTKHDKFKEVIKSAWIFCYEWYVSWFLNLSFYYWRRAFNDCILLEFTLFVSMQFICNFLLHCSHLFSKSLYFSMAFTVTTLYFTIGRLNPTHWNRKIHRHKKVIVIVYERNAITDIFLITNLVILWILIECSLVFTNNGCFLEIFAF